MPDQRNSQESTAAPVLDWQEEAALRAELAKAQYNLHVMVEAWEKATEALTEIVQQIESETGLTESETLTAVHSIALRVLSERRPDA